MSSRSPLTNTELSRSARLHGICIAVLLITFATTNAVKAATVVWSNAAASTAWYTNTNWTANTSSTQWTTSDIAQFANAGTATTAGINMGTSALSIGAIEITSARTRALTIGNSSATSGNLTLNATTVNGVSNVIVRNASGSALTIQNNETGTGKTMDVALSNNADNKIMVDGAGGVVISSIIKSVSGSTPLTIAGSGTGSVTLSGANTYAGGTTLNAGNIVLGNAAGLSTGTLTVGLGSNLDAGTGYTGGTTGNRNTKAMLNTVALTGAVTVANNIVLPADTVLNTRTIYAKGSSGNSTRFTGDISGGSANLSLFLNSDGANNAGIFRFSGNNTFVTSSDTGANSGINLNRGSLQIDSNAALGADTNSLFMDSYTGQQLIFTSGFTYTHPTTLESGVQTIFVSNGTAGSQLDITAPLGGGDSTSSLRLTSGTSGDKTTTYRLAGTNTLSGKIELYRGAVIITNNNSLGNAALQLNGNNNTTLGDVRFENSVTLANNIELVNTANPDPIHTGGNTVVLNGVVSSTGTAALVKIGAGTLVLGGNNTYSVGTVVNAGVLRINGVSSLPATTALTLNGGVLGLGVADFTRALGTAAGQVQFTGSGGFAAYGADRNVNLGGASAQVTWGSGSFVPAGSALILGAADATNKVTFQNPIDFGGATRTIQVVKGSGGATYDAELSGSLSNGSYTQTGDGTLRISGPVGGTAYTQNAAGTLNVESVISTTTFTQSGSGSAVSVSGSGSIASPTANFNAGATQLGNAGTNTAVTSPNIVIGGGSLVIAGSEQISDTSNVALNSGSFGFNGAGKTETVFTFTNSGGTFITGANTLIGTGATVTWSGGINTVSNGGNVTDAHIVITGGTNTIQGGAIGGVLQLNAGGAGLEITGADLNLNSDAAVAGKLLLKGDVTSHASTTTSNISNAGSQTQTGKVDLDGGARTVTVEQGTTPAGKDLSVSAEVTNGSLVKAGAGTLELKAANTYSGGTTVNAGTVLANNTSGSATGSGTVTVNGASAVLGGTGNVAGATTVTLGQIRPGTSSITGEMQFGSDLTLSGSTPGTRMTVRLGAALAADGNDSADFTSHLNDGSFGLWVLSQAAPLESMNGGVHDRASLTGNLNLNAGGQIFVDSLGYAPAFGDVFDLFDWANLSAGTFDFGGTHRPGGLIGDLSLPALNAGLAYDLSLFNASGSSGIVLVVPEPSRAGLVFVALAALCLRRRRSVA